MAHVNLCLTGSLALTLIAASTVGGAALHAESMSRPGAGAMMAPAAMIQGSFRKAEAPVSGGFVIRREGSRKLLVLSSDFRTNDMAPDLKVIFIPSTTPLASSKAPGFPLKPGSYTILAALKASSGAQTYTIPDSIDLNAQGSLLIWCQKFNATMAWAPLKV